MGRKSLFIPATAFFVALLVTAGLANESEDIALKPVDLKKDGFDVTLQALPSGEPLHTISNVPSQSHLTVLLELQGTLAMPWHSTLSYSSLRRPHVCATRLGLMCMYACRAWRAHGVLCGLVPGMQALPATL